LLFLNPGKYFIIM